MTIPPPLSDIVQDFLNGLSTDDNPSSFVYSKEHIDPSSLPALEALLLRAPPANIALTPGERLILAHIQQQTRWIQQLHQRMDALQQMQNETNVRKVRFLDDPAHPVAAAAEAPHAPVPPQRQRNAPAARQIRRNPLEEPQNLWLPQMPPRWPETWTKLRRCCTLYFELHRRFQEQQNNPNVDPLFLLKILVMVAILMSRLPPRLTGNTVGKDEDADQRFILQYLIISIVIMVAFILRSGRFAFMYAFFWKYNIPRRVWSQPEAEVTAAQLWEDHWAPQVPAPPRGPPVAPPRLQWWLLHDWLQGEALHPPPHAAPAPRSVLQRVLLFLQDVIVFLLSFVLSIFPMWRNLDPQALFPARDALPNNANPEEEERMPMLAAPRDPAANDEEDEDDEEEDE